MLTVNNVRIALKLEKLMMVFIVNVCNMFYIMLLDDFCYVSDHIIIM